MADYTLSCREDCTFHPDKSLSEFATTRLIDGIPYRTIAKALLGEGLMVSITTLARHKKHIHAVEEEVAPGPKVTNIEILETIIQKGFGNSKNWKPTIGDTMKAMDMWFRLTSGNPFESLLDAMAAATVGEEEIFDPAASRSDEREELIDDTSGP